jgi:uncharacterized protein
MTDPTVPPEIPAAPEPAVAAEPEERYPFWGYVDLLVFFGLAFPSMLLGWAAVKVVFGLLGLKPAARAAEPLAIQMVGYVILFAALAMLLRVQYDRPLWKSLAWNSMRVPPALVAAYGVATAMVVAVIGALIQTPNTKNLMTEMMGDKVSFALMAVFGITLGPLCEELAFRGLLQPLLVRSLGPVAGIVLAAIPFGFLHYKEYGNSWRHAVIVAAAGAAFGWMRHATGSTKAATLMHSAYNTFFFGVFLAQK